MASAGGLSLGQEFAVLVRLLDHQQLDAFANGKFARIPPRKIQPNELWTVAAAAFYVWDMGGCFFVS